MNKIKLESKNTPLFKYYRGELIVILNIQEEFKDEVKFKNSAFVNTGRKVPTGTYTAYEQLVDYGHFMSLSFNDVESKILSKINSETRGKILNGFIWNGLKVWLSEQNQQNYTSWSIALNSGQNILPLTAKFTDMKNNKEIYYSFNDKEEFNDFYGKMVKHINNCVSLNRELKDNYYNNKDNYKKEFQDLKNLYL